MVYYITFQPHLCPADDTSLYIFAYKCIHTGIICQANIFMKNKTLFNTGKNGELRKKICLDCFALKLKFSF